MGSITPELALIDSELAATARVLLPGPGEFRPAWRTQPTRAVRLSAPAPPAAEAQASRLPVGRFRRAALTVCALAIAVAVGGTAASTWVGPSEATPTDVERRVKEARTYTWPTVSGAQTYKVRLARGRETVWSATTTVAAAELPAGLQLAPGRYTWSATPGFGQPPLDAAARPVVEVTFQVA